VTSWTTGAAILEFRGIVAPSTFETNWANACAVAVNAGIDRKLNGALVDGTSPGFGELTAAAQLAGGECFSRRSTPFGVTNYADLTGVAIRVARDYLDSIGPLVARWSNGPGIG
jgi:hypothetical protein